MQSECSLMHGVLRTAGGSAFSRIVGSTLLWQRRAAQRTAPS